MVNPEIALEARELSRSYGRHLAVRAVSFSLSRGESLALFGPNGAGKTTLLRLLAGLLRPTAGSVSIGGVGANSATSARGRIGLISHQTMLYPALTALENVEFSARLHGLPAARETSMRALERVGIANRAGSLVRSLSRGMQQRVSIARAVVHDPVVLLLDEPYTGLDAAGATALSNLLHGVRTAGATMVLVTHNVTEGLAVVSHAAVMVKGRIERLDASTTLDPARFADEYRALVGVGAVAVAT